MRKVALISVLALLVLSACTSTETTLGSAAEGANGQPAAQPAPVPASPAAPQPAAPPTSAQIAALSGVRMQFAPVVGASVEAAAPLSRRLRARATERGIAIAQTSAEQPTHLMKGYFSAVSEEESTLVIFVWDVLDPSGARLHRIQGQEQVSAVSSDGWSAVPAATMETIADRTLDEFTRWFASRSG